MKTIISISEKTNKPIREEKIIIHDDWQYHIGSIKDKKQLEQVLEFLEIELKDIVHQKECKHSGEIIYYRVSKSIVDTYIGGFWNIEQLLKISNGKKLKKFKGLSNGSMVDCYAGIGEDIIEIYRPNPNAKEVYQPMGLLESIDYMNNNWYL